MKYPIICYKGGIPKVELKGDLPILDLRIGTCLQEVILVSYARLVEVFGEPNGQSDEFKTDVEWVIMTPKGVATIYNWKNGKNYLGDEGLPVEDITEWNIGGHTRAVVEHITRALGVSLEPTAEAEVA